MYKTVIGKTQLDVFTDALTGQDKYLGEYFSTETTFKFVDETDVTASRKVKFPTIIVRKNIMIESCIVNNEIPLLLSKTTMT